MVKRFIEHFQIWRKQRAAGFEDKFLAWLPVADLRRSGSALTERA
jgi:hypothetical protein